ncbi:MAG TPA: NAD(P)-binding domain-containing protein [Candidatus Thermoplasmatota archaeon]|nr:NAD(P)-binding domain-containing protein [Candidatus Thermoplasmatota archaeon]
MRVGIIGSGQVGQTLAAGFAKKGHDVVLGTRDPKKALAETKAGPQGQPPLSAWAKANPRVKVVTMAEAARHGEVLAFVVHGAEVAEAVKQAGADNMAGKLVLDTTNPLEFGPDGAHIPKGIKDSCLQTAQRAAPGARFVKAWNCTPGSQMVDPKEKGDQFICGDDAKAKEQAAKLLKEFGWNVRDVGDASMAPYVEGMALTVINWAAKANDWGWVVKVPGAK